VFQSVITTVAIVFAGVGAFLTFTGTFILQLPCFVKFGRC
jgi:hypothetical protein